MRNNIFFLYFIYIIVNLKSPINTKPVDGKPDSDLLDHFSPNGWCFISKVPNRFKYYNFNFALFHLLQ